MAEPEGVGDDDELDAESFGLPEPGDVLANKYTIERLLGQGGMGAVFAARHELLGQRVALKLVLGRIARIPEARRRFMNEARAAFRLQSEHIARVLDVDLLETGNPFMVLEYLEGRDLKDILAEGRLSVEVAIDYVLQVLDAVAQAHAAGIVHRDLKPANLFVIEGGDGVGHIKVLDFGISKVAKAAGVNTTGLTGADTMLGTPFYMSPEQFRSSRTVDARSDIWAIGVILFELLSGERPYNGNEVGEVFAAIFESEQPPPIRRLRPDAPAELERIITKCLQRRVEDRYQDVGELARDLAPFATPARQGLLARIGRAARSTPAPTARISEPRASMPQALDFAATELSPPPAFVPDAWREVPAPAAPQVPAPVGSPPQRGRGLLIVVAVVALTSALAIGAVFGLRARAQDAAASAAPVVGTTPQPSASTASLATSAGPTPSVIVPIMRVTPTIPTSSASEPSATLSRSKGVTGPMRGTGSRGSATAASTKPVVAAPPETSDLPFDPVRGRK